jgi:hypothetical protein
MIVEYRQADGSSLLFGYQMPAGALSAATGRIVRAWHHKHYHVDRKREARGDVVTGRVMSGAPTGYQIADAAAEGTQWLSNRMEHLARVARRIGKGVGDAQVIEAARADEHGGPYLHEHRFALEPYQLHAHLRYAHGHDPDGGGTSLTHAHAELHARQALERTTGHRAADGEPPPQTRDWREQYAVDL